MHNDLVRLARGRHLAVCLVAAILGGLLVLVQAELLAGVLSGRFTVAALAALVAVIGARALLVVLGGSAAASTATRVKAALRRRLMARLPSLTDRRSGEVVTLAGRGLDALDPYLTGYLPAVAIAAVVPVAVLVRLFAADLATALVVLVTLPLIPIFGALIGWQTRMVTERQWRALSRLGGHFLDVVRGLPTLRAFGRARFQASVIREVADDHRAATMRTLRVAFLSSLVLELVASLSLALVAVPIGLRLLSGSVDLPTALLVLLLAPEAYLPLRAAGAKFHAAMEGVSAADQAFTALESRDVARGRLPLPASRQIRLENVTVTYDGREALRDISLAIEPGERVALVGESGVGKSTLLNVILGFVAPTKGHVLIGGVDLAELDLAEWRTTLAYVPQRPHLFAATVEENIRLGSAAPPVGAPALDFVESLPDGYDTVLGERGVGLSAGQRQRIALARAFCRPSASILLLDEPTARLDGRTEAAIVSATRELSTGRTAVIVAHRPAMIELADRVVHLS